MANRQRRHTIAPPPQAAPAPPPAIRISTRTTDIGGYGMPSYVTKQERQLIADAIKAVIEVDAPTEMAKLDLYLIELQTRGLEAYMKEIKAARETLHTVMRSGGEWKALMTQSEGHWVLHPMLMRLS